MLVCRQQLHDLCALYWLTTEIGKILRCIYDSGVVINGDSTRYCSKSMDVVVVVVVVVSSSQVADRVISRR